MITQNLVESSWGTADLSSDQADTLRDLGRRLASDKTWWGSDPGEVDPERTVVRCERISGDRHRVRVSDAIGVIGVGNTQLIVEPKIPLDHLVYLLQQADQIPRLTDHQTRIEQGESFHDLIARWFLISVEQLLRRGLLSDYTAEFDELRAARGKVNVLPTTRAILAGRPVIHCEYDEFNNDTALNRILHGAAGLTARSMTLDPDLRRRATQLRARIEPVSRLRRHDLRHKLDRRSAYYRDAVTLARCIIAGHAGTLGGGETTAGTFLFRTPEAVEEGIRRILASGLKGHCDVQKTGLDIAGTRKRRLNPDLVFGYNQAIGDVKYSRLDNGLKRSHINQLTTFATGYRTTRALLIGFGNGAAMDEAVVGDVSIRALNWESRTASPAAAALRVIADVKKWISEPEASANPIHGTVPR